VQVLQNINSLYLNLFLVDIFNNLHGAVGKTAVVKILTSLSERGEISAKAYGKQWVYVARQDLLPVPSSEDLNAIDDEINELKDELQKEKEQMKMVQSKLNMMNSSLTTEELQRRIVSLKVEVAEMHERLEPLERGTVKVDPDERARIEKQYETANKAWKSRKKLCNDIIGMLTESISKKPSEFMEELGLEVDPV
jgi:26S proteasome regulatory subunit (ATPase 3-interacting protein)